MAERVQEEEVEIKRLVEGEARCHPEKLLLKHQNLLPNPKGANQAPARYQKEEKKQLKFKIILTKLNQVPWKFTNGILLVLCADGIWSSEKRQASLGSRGEGQEGRWWKRKRRERAVGKFLSSNLFTKLHVKKTNQNPNPRDWKITLKSNYAFGNCLQWNMQTLLVYWLKHPFKNNFKPCNILMIMTCS